MARTLRAVLLLAVVVAVSPAAATAAPELGGRLSPVPFVAERDEAVNLTNLSTIPVVVTIEADGGWSLAVDTLTLDVGERVSVDVTAAGPDDATIRAILRPVDALQAPDTAALALETTARHLRPWEALDGPWWLLLALVGGFAIMLGVRRRVGA